MSITHTRPTVGQITTVHGKRCRIVAVYKFGTIDVEACDGSRAWRITGLAFI